MGEKLLLSKKQKLLQLRECIRINIPRDVEEQFAQLMGKHQFEYIETEKELIIKIQKEA